MEQSELALTGIGAEGDVRVVELPPHRFFLATLFLPQWGSTAEQPDPLIVAYLQAVQARVIKAEQAMPSVLERQRPQAGATRVSYWAYSDQQVYQREMASKGKP